ncbi:MAG: endonuclease [Cyanothece sp. SIO1E1]|nr:endonuclease [Cyanothece sp. SIO1E1]
MIKKIVSILISALFSIFLIAAPSWAITVSPGDRVQLQAKSSLGIPLHRTSSSSLIGRAPDETIAEVVGTANNQRWVEIELPDGNQRWIVERYISRVIPQQSEPLPDSGNSDVDSREVTALVSQDDQLTVAALNVENLDPGDRERFAPLGQLIVENLGAPDIVVLTEIQDNDGPADSTTTAATQTYNDLIAAIETAGGPAYIAIDIAPERNIDGGQPGGNIRVGYLYQPQRVALATGTAGTATEAIAVLEGPTLSLNPGRIEPDNSAFDRSRKPLAAEFRFNQNPVFIVGNHFASKRSNNDAKRAEQATLVGDFVGQLLVKDVNAKVIVAGDLNDLNDSEPINILEASGLTNLSDLLEESDRYTYEFRNRLQQLDYILVSQDLADDANAEFDIVHVNVNQPNALSDHDPVLARFTLPEAAPVVIPGTSEVILPGLSGEALRSRLATDYRVENSLGYNKARDYMYSQLDNDDGVVRGIYSDFAVSVNPDSSRPRSEAFQNGQGINAEHSWPQSKGATGVAKSDLHHLFPARARVNSRRGSLPFAEIDDLQTERWILDDDELSAIPTTNINAYSEAVSQAFEPREDVKGNIARALFYFYTVYRSQAEPGFFQQQADTLCHWNLADPVDAAEVERSHAIATQQGNDNPFVLDLTLAQRLYCKP